MATFFLNAKWTESNHPDTSTKLKWNGRSNYTTIWCDANSEPASYNADAAYCASDLQAAINFAKADDTFVFYDLSGGSDSADFKFYDPRGTVIIDKNLTFRTGHNGSTSDTYTSKAVKFDSLEVLDGNTLTFEKGLFSLDDLLIVDNGATMKVVNNTHINADLIQNDEQGTILVDTTSRLVAASIDEGIVKIQTGQINNEKRKWVDRPVVAHIGEDVTLKFAYPGNVDGTDLNKNDNTFKHIFVAKKNDGSSIYYYVEGEEVPQDVKNNPGNYTIYNYDVTTDYESLFLINHVFDLNNPVNGTYSTAAMYVTASSGDTIQVKRQDTNISGSSTATIFASYHDTTDSANPVDYNLARSTVVAALNSDYGKAHTIGTENEGIVIRVQEGSYTETAALEKITRNMILEPDKYWDGQKWVYDVVDIQFGSDEDVVKKNTDWITGDLNIDTVQNLLTFAHLNELEIHDWAIGGNNDNNSVVSFVDIKKFTINYRLKAQYGANILIDNCDEVISNRHFSINGGTIIVRGSTVYLNGGYVSGDWGGSLSTENTSLGSGSFILQNSDFIVADGTGRAFAVNLKEDAEFIISGQCKVVGAFTDLKGKSDTHITFRDAILAPGSEIRSQEDLPDRGANLHFEGNNTFDNASVTQAGGQAMYVDPGATVDLSNGSFIALDDYNNSISTITNNGLINLDSGSHISTHEFVNSPEASLTVDGGSYLQTDSFVNANGAVFSATLTPDGTLPIISVTPGETPKVENTGTIILDASGLDYHPDRIYLDNITGTGEVILKVEGGGISVGHEEGEGGRQYIDMGAPDTTTLQVNSVWNSAENPCSRGKNVGLFTYYGYNAFSDNGNPDDPDDAMWKAIKGNVSSGTTKKIIYTGMEESATYGNLDLSVAASENGITIQTVERDDKKAAAYFGTLTAGGKPVTLSGATAGMDAIVVNVGGKLNVNPGESAKLQLAVAKESVERDVQIKVKSGMDSEIFSVRVPAGESIVELSSNRFSVGQSYYVTITDKSVYEATDGSVADSGNGEPVNTANGKLTIDVAIHKDVERFVDVTVRGAATENKNVIYEFLDCRVPKANETISLSPAFGDKGVSIVSITSEPVDPLDEDEYSAHASLVYDHDNGRWKLLVNKDTVDRTMTVKIKDQPNNQTMTYTFTLEGGTGTQEEMLPTRFIANKPYYVMLEEPEVTATAMTDSMDSSDIRTNSMINNGTLEIASEIETKKIHLELDSSESSPENRIATVQVVNSDTEFDKTYSVLVPANATSFDLFSDDFTAGVTYSATVTIDGDETVLGDNTPVAANVIRKAAEIKLEHLDEEDSARKITVTVNVDGEDKVYTVFVPENSTTAKLASPDFKVGETYAVTVEDNAAAYYKAKTLSKFNAENVTNNNSIIVRDADFTAGTLDNLAGKTVDATNSQLAITNLDNSGSVHAKSGTIISVSGAFANSGEITLDVTSTLTISSGAGSISNTGTISYVYIAGNADEQNFQVTGGSFNNVGGTITIDVSAADFTGDVTKLQVTDFAVNGGIVNATGKEGVRAVRDSDHLVWLINANADTTTLYVDNIDGWGGEPGSPITSAWPPESAELRFDINAFTDADGASEGIAADTTKIMFKGNSGATVAYSGGLDLSAAAANFTVTADVGTEISLGALTAAGTSTVTLSGIDLVATGVTNSGNIAVAETASLTVSGNVTNTGSISYKFVNGDVSTNEAKAALIAAQVFQVDGDVNNAGGTITIDASAANLSPGEEIQVTDFAVIGGAVIATNKDGVVAIRDADNCVWLIATPADMTTLYVDNMDSWAGTAVGAKIQPPGWNPDEKELYYGINAFSSGDAIANGIATNTTAIKIRGGNDDNYGNFDLSQITNPSISITTDDETAVITSLSTATGKTVTLNAADLNATGTVTNNGTLEQTISGSLTADTLTNSGTFSQTAGTLSATTLLTNNAGAEMTFTNAVNATTLTNSGTINQTDGTINAVTFTNSAIFNQTAGTLSTTTLTNNAGATMALANALTVTGEGAEITNSGTINQSAGSISANTLTNSGRINQTDGSLSANTLTNNAGATMALKGTLTVNSSFTNAGTLNQTGGKLIDVNGDITNSGVFKTNGNIETGTSGDNGTVTNSGSFGQTDGTLTAASITNVDSATMTFNSAVSLSGTITNSGTFNQAGGTITTNKITNNAGATITATGTVSVTGNDGVTNSGTFNQTGGTITTKKITNNAGATMTVGGTVSVTGNDGIKNSGTFNQAGGSIVVKNGNTKKNFEVAGTFIQSSGTLTAATLKTTAETSKITIGSAGTVSVSNVELVNDKNSSITVKGKLTVDNQFLIARKGQFVANGNADVETLLFESWSLSTVSILYGTLKVKGDEGIKNNNVFTLGTENETSNAYVLTKNFVMRRRESDPGDGHYYDKNCSAKVSVYKGAKLEIGSWEDQTFTGGLLIFENIKDNTALSLLVDGGTVRAGTISNDSKCKFTIKGEATVVADDAIEGDGGIELNGATIGSDTRLMEAGTTAETTEKTITVAANTSNVINGSSIRVKNLTVNQKDSKNGVLTISNTTFDGFTVTDAVENHGSITVKDQAKITVGSITNDTNKIFNIAADSTVRVTGAGISGGTVNVITDGLGTTLTDDLYIVVDGNVEETTVKFNLADPVDGKVNGYTYVNSLAAYGITGHDKGIFLLKNDTQTPTTLYVSADYTGEAGTITADGHVVGWNAFSTFDTALKNITNQTEKIVLVSDSTESVEGNVDAAFENAAVIINGNKTATLNFATGNDLCLTPAEGGSLTIDADTTIKTIGTSYGDAYIVLNDNLNDKKNSGTVYVNGTVDSTSETALWGKTVVSETGKLNGDWIVLFRSGIAAATNNGAAENYAVTINGSGIFTGDNAQTAQVTGHNFFFASGVVNTSGASVNVNTFLFSQLKDTNPSSYIDNNNEFVKEVTVGDTTVYKAVLNSTNSFWTIETFDAASEDVKYNGEFNFTNNSTLNVTGTASLGDKVSLNLTNSAMTVGGAFTNAGTITVDALSTITATNGISGGSIDVGIDGLGDTLTDNLYIVVEGTLSETEVTFNGSSVNVGTEIGTTGYVYLDTLGEKHGIFLRKNTNPTTLYVSADYTGDAGTITADGHEIGRDAFSSFLGAMGKALEYYGETISNITIQVLTDIEEEYSGSLYASNTFKGLTIKGAENAEPVTVTLKNTSSSARQDLFLSTTDTVNLENGVDFVMAEQNDVAGIWLNYNGSDGSTVGVSSSIQADMIGIKGSNGTPNSLTEVKKTGTLTSTGSILILMDENAELTVAGKDGGDAVSLYSGNTYQVNADSILFAGGKVTVTDTNIRTNDFSYTDVPGDTGAAVMLTSTNTSWEITGDLKVRFYNDVPEANKDNFSGTFTFTNDSVNISGSILNTPAAEAPLTELEYRKAMAITLDNSYMSVGGGIENAGTVSVGNNSILIADSITNTGTITVNGSRLTTGTVNTNGATFTVSGESTLSGKNTAAMSLTGTIAVNSGATLTDSNITGGGITAAGTLTVTNSTISSNMFTANADGVNVIFSGTNVLDGVTLDAANRTVTNSGTLTIDALSLISADTVTSAGSCKIYISADGLGSGFVKVIDVTTTGSLNIGDGGNVLLVEGAPANVHLFQMEGSDDVYIGNEDKSTIYVGSAYTMTGAVVNGHLVGYNAFSMLDKALLAATDATTTITIESANTSILAAELSYVAQNTSVAINGASYVNTISGNQILDLTPMNNGTLAINTAITSDKEIYLNSIPAAAPAEGYVSTSGTVNVTAAIESGKKVELWGNVTVSGDGAIVSPYSEGNGIIVVRAGKSADAELTVTGAANQTSAQLNASSIILASGTVETTGTVVSANHLSFRQNLDIDEGEDSIYWASEVVNDDGGHTGKTGAKFVLNSTNTNWTADDFNAADGVKIAGEFNFSGGAFNVNGAAGLNDKEAVELGNDITVNLTNNALFNVANGKINNAGTINVTNATVSAASLDNSANDPDDPDDDGTITVSGTSKLTIDTLSGTIELLDGAEVVNSTIKSSGILHAGTHEEGEPVQTVGNNVTFTGTNTFACTIENSGTITVSGTMTSGEVNNAEEASFTVNNGATLTVNGSFDNDDGAVLAVNGTMSATGAIDNEGTIRVNGTLTVNGVIDNTNDSEEPEGTITVNALATITATAVSDGVINVSTEGLTIEDMTEDTYHVVTAALQNGVSVKLNNTDATSVTIGTKTYYLATLADSGVYLTTQTQDTLYVNSEYTESSCGDHIYGYNAFSTLADALSAAVSETATITLESDTEATDVENVYKAFENASVTINGAFDGEIDFASGNDLCLTPAAGGSLVIASGTRIATVGDKNSAYIVLNYGRTTGTVTVNGTLDSSTEIALWGTTTVGTTGSLIADHDGIILFRSGYAAAANGAYTTDYAVTIGELEEADKPEIRATWFDFASGVVNINNATVTATKFLYSQNLGGNGAYEPSEAEFAVTDTIRKAVLNSHDVTWEIGDFEADGNGDRTDGTKNYITHYGEFNFAGDTIEIANYAKLDQKITLNLTDNARFNVANGKINNAGTINVTDSTLTAAAVTTDTGTFTVAGESTLNIGNLSGMIETDSSEDLTMLNASGITNGMIYAQNNLKFTGANTLKDITLNANTESKTVTVETGDDNSLTVAGTSELHIGMLVGDIVLLNSTIIEDSEISGDENSNNEIAAEGQITVKDSTISSSSIIVTDSSYIDSNEEQQTVEGLLTFSGINELNDVELDGAFILTHLATLSDSEIAGVEGTGITAEGQVKVEDSTISSSSIAVTNYTNDVETIAGVLAFTGDNELSETSVNAAEYYTVTNTSGTLSLTSESQLSAHTILNTAGTLSLTSESQLSAHTISNTENGTLSIEAGSTVVANSITGGLIDIITLDGESQSILANRVYLVVDGSIDYDSVTLAIDGAEQENYDGTTDISIHDGYTLVTLGGRGIWLTNQTQSTIYVDAAYTTVGEIIDDYLLVGYNAFDSLIAALDVAKDLAADTTIIVTSDITEDEQTTDLFWGPADNPVTFKNNILIECGKMDEDDNPVPVTIDIPFAKNKELDEYGDVIDNDNKDGADPNADLCLQSAPGEPGEPGKKFEIGENITIKETPQDDDHGIWLNYRGTGSGHLVSGTIGKVWNLKIGGETEIAATAKLIAHDYYFRKAPAAGDVQITIFGDGNFTDTYQIEGDETGGMMFESGTVYTDDTRIRTGWFTFSDGEGGPLDPVVLESYETVWDIKHDMQIKFYNTSSFGDYSGTFMFEECTLNVDGNLVNVPKETTTGSDVGSVVEGAPAMEIYLIDSVITVGTYDGEGDWLSGGDITNSGTIELQNGSKLKAHTITDNSGTITVDATSLITASDITNNGTITVDGTGYSSGMVKVIDVADNATLTLANISLADGAPDGVRLLQGQDKDIYVGVVDQTTLYVNGAWSMPTHLTGEEVADGKYYGINAFSNLYDALTHLASTTTTINVISNNAFTTTNEAYDLVNVAPTQNLAIQTDPDTSSFITSTINFKSADMTLSPADGKTVTVGRYVTITGYDTDRNSCAYIVLNYAGSTGDIVIEGTVDSESEVAFYGNSTVSVTGRVISRPETFEGDHGIVLFRSGYAAKTNGKNVVFDLDVPDKNQYVVSITGDATDTESATFTQVNSQLFLLQSGVLSIRNSKVESLVFLYGQSDGELSVDEFLLDGSTRKAVLYSDNTKWNLTSATGNNGYTFDASTAVFQNGELDFVNKSTVDVAGNAIVGALVALNLDASDMTVGGNFTNAGTIQVNASTVTATSVTNNGTFTVEGVSQLVIDALAGSNAIQLLNGARIVNSAITSGGTLNVASGNSVQFGDSTMETTSIDNSGEITILTDNTLTSGNIDNKIAAATITVTGTLYSGDIRNSGVGTSSGGITVSGTLNSGDIDNDGEITVNGTLSATGSIDNNDGTINIGNIGALPAITAASIDNTSGTITINAAGFTSGMKKVIDVDSKTGLDLGPRIALTAAATGVRLIQLADGDICITNQTQDQTTLYVNSEYTESSCDGHIYGYNAFATTDDAQVVINSVSTVTALIFTAQATYGGLELSLDRNFSIGQQSDAESVTLGSLTITRSKADATTLTVAAGANLIVAGPWSLGAKTGLANNGTMAVSLSTTNAAITAESINNAGTITIDASAYTTAITDTVTVIDVTTKTELSLDSDHITVDNLRTGASLLQKLDGDICIGVVSKTALHVDSEWSTPAHLTGEEVATGQYYGINAFSTAADVTGAITSDTTSITFAASTSSYGNLNLSGDNVGNITLAVSGTGTAKIGDLTTKIGQTVNLTGAYSFDGTFVNNGTISTSNALSVNGTVSGSKLGTISTSAALTVEDFTLGGGDSITGSGAVTLKNVTVDSDFTAGNFSNEGTLTVTGNSTLTAGAITNGGTLSVNVGSSISATSIAGGSIELTGVGSGTAVGTYQFVTTTDGIGSDTSFTCTIDAETITFNAGETGTSHTADNKYWFTKTANGISLTVVSPAQTALYVNDDWTDVADGTLVTYGGITLVKGTNAFGNVADAFSHVTSDTSAITLLSNSTASDSGDRYIAFGNSGVEINGAFDGEIDFASGHDLCLTPNAGGTLTIASGTTISTVGDKNSAYIVLNYGRTTGTVTVNGTLDSSTEIALWGTTTVGATGRLVSNDDGIILFRSGYTGASAAVTVTGKGTYDENDAAQIDATWFFLASGAVSVTDSKVNAVKFKFDQNLDSIGNAYTANDDAGTAAVLNSDHTEWTIGEIVANGSGITKNGEFNFENGSVVTVTGDAAFCDKIALNLTASGMTVGGDLANAGAITVAAGTKGTESNVCSMLSVTGEAANYAGSVVLDNDGAIAAGTTYGITVTNSQFDVAGALANTGAILVNSSSLIVAASIDNANADGPRGIIVIDASDYEAARTAKADTDYVFTLGDSTTETTTYVKVIDVADNQGTTLSLADVFLTDAEPGICLLQLEDGDICVGRVDQSTLYVNSSWDDNTQAGKEVSGGEFYDYNAYSGLAAAIGKAKETDAEIVVEKLGTQSTTTEGYVYDSTQPVIQLGDVKTTIKSTDTTYQKAIYGGEKIGTDGITPETPTATRNTEIEVSGGNFNKFIVGGNNINLVNAGDSYTVTAKTVTVPDPTDATKEITVALPQTVEVTGGIFNGIVATGDRVQKGELTLNSDLEMNINGGKFTAYVAGGVMNALYEKSGETETTNGKADVYGNVSLNITSGEFTDSCWIYGGCISTSRSVSSYASTIYGDVTVTVDCGTGNTIQLSHLAAGSHGMGAIKVNETTSSGGNTAIVFKGDGSNLSFTANGELWGGSGRDNLNARTGICEDSFVEGDRLLSFEGFRSDNFNSNRIRDFSSIQLIGESEVGITGSSVDLCGIENWTFEYDSSLSGNFGNNFENDTLTLDLSNLGVVSNGLSWTLLENSNSDAFTGFGDLFENVETVAEAEECTVEAYCEAHRLTVQVKTETMTQWGWDSDNNCYSGTIGDYSGTLALDNTKTKMILTLA